MPNPIYIQNKYLNWYNSIISKAQNRSTDLDAYYENHHIIPKSFGGTNDKTNLVLLTGREHFICHYLLTKFTNEPSMINAFWLMCHCKTENQTERYTKLSAKQYNSLRTKFSSKQKGSKRTLESRIKQGNSQTGKLHNSFKGYYVTPWGTFYSKTSASVNCPKPLSTSVLNNWYKNTNKPISKTSISLSKYLTEDMLGKTFKDIGFIFISHQVC